LPRRQRIRCSFCGRRIPAESEKCPRCGKDPRANRVPGIARLLALLVALLLCVCIGWVAFRVIATNVERVLSPTATRAPTRVVQVIHIVATPPAPTPTFTPNPTATPIFSPTPTRRAAGQTRGSSTTTPALPQGFYPAPQLIAPANTTVYASVESIILLEWQPVAATLRENEWYAITITYAARDGNAGEEKGYTKEARWTVPNKLWKEVSKDARAFKWNVAVIRIEGADPFTTPSRTFASPNSITRTFYWN
jgi:hypothetical protein